MANTLQLSGTENVWIGDDGYVTFYGNACLPKSRFPNTGIEYPPEFILQIIDYLTEHTEFFQSAVQGREHGY